MWYTAGIIVKAERMGKRKRSFQKTLCRGASHILSKDNEIILYKAYFSPNMTSIKDIFGEKYVFYAISK